MKRGELTAALRTLESEHDIPAKVRLQWLQEAMAHITDVKLKVIAKAGLRRLQRAMKRPKYDVMYDIQPLITLAFRSSEANLTDRLILQLRLTTLMRSGDMATLVWAIFWQDGHHFLRCTSKTGSCETFNIEDPVLDTVMEYLYEHRMQPAIFLVRHTTKPALCMGAERIAKRCLQLMQNAGIPVDVYKAHSLRAATATHFQRLGVQKDLIQGRGRWSTPEAMDRYYLKLHAECNWAEMLQGVPARFRQPAASAVHSTTSPPDEADEGRRSGGDEEKGTARAAALRALSILRPLHDSTVCPACNQSMTREAAYKCSKCSSTYHVRCMGHYTGVGSTTLSYYTTCFLCTMTATMPPPQERPRSQPLIEDPMGVCGP